MSDTPITDKIIADADSCPETRVVFLIKHLANQCKAFERASRSSTVAPSEDDHLHVMAMVRGMLAQIKNSPGLSHAPFSEVGWKIVYDALTAPSATGEKIK